MSETPKEPERSKKSGSKSRSKPAAKALPVARVVSPPVEAAAPEHWRKRLQGRRKRPWLATSTICVTVLAVPLMIWWSGREVPRGTERVAEAGPGPVLATADADDRRESSPAQALPAERAGDAAVVSTDAAAPGDPLTTNGTTNATDDEPAAAAFDAGSLDVSLLAALEPEKIGEAGRFAEEVSNVHALALSPDGRLAASGGEDGAIRLWNVESKQPAGRLDGHAGTVECLAFSADGDRLLSGGVDGTIRVWDVATGSEAQRLAGHRQAVSDVAFAPDSRSIHSIDVDGGLKKWDLATGEAVRSLDGGAGFAKLAVSPAGDAILVGGWDGSIHRWDGTSPGWTHPLISGDGEPIRKHAAAIVHLHVDEAGTVTSADERGDVATWNVSTGEETGRFATGGLVLGHVPSAGGAVILSADPEGTVRVWDPETESVTHELVGHEGPVAALVRSSSGELAVSAGRDGTLRLWSLPVFGEQ